MVFRLRGCRGRRRGARALKAISRWCSVRHRAWGRCEIAKVVVVIVHSQEIGRRCSGSEGPSADGSPHAHGGRLSPPPDVGQITPAHGPRRGRREASSASITAGEIISHGSKRIDLARARQDAVEAHGPLPVTQPRHLGRPRWPRGLGTVDEAEEVIEVGSRGTVLVGVGGSSDEGDVVERQLGARGGGKIEVQGVPGVDGGETTVGRG